MEAPSGCKHLLLRGIIPKALVCLTLLRRQTTLMCEWFSSSICQPHIVSCCADLVCCVCVTVLGPSEDGDGHLVILHHQHVQASRDHYKGTHRNRGALVSDMMQCQPTTCAFSWLPAENSPWLTFLHVTALTQNCGG